MVNNYTLGRGKLYFDRFASSTATVGEGERYLGNTPSFSMQSQAQVLDHFSSDEGVQEKDMAVTLRNDRNAKFTTDNIDPKNIALIFGTEASTRAVSAATGLSQNLTVQRGLYYQIGTSADAPEGIQNLASLSVVDSTGVKASGTLTFGGQPTAADTLTINGHVITFVTGASAANQVTIGGSATITAQAVKALINSLPGTYLVTAAGAATVLTLSAVTAGTGGNSIALAKSGTYPSLSGSVLSGGLSGVTIDDVDNYTVDLVNGRIYILEDATDIADDDALVVTYATNADSQSLVVDDGEEVIGAMRFISNNPVGSNRNYFWPKVKMTSDGEYALKGDTWLAMSFSVEILKKDSATKRVYIKEVAES